MVSEEISSSALTRMGSSTIIVEASGYNKKSFVHKPRCSHGVVPHVVMLAYPLQGHVTPLHRLANLLSSSGVFVTFVTTESNVSRLRTKSASSSDSINNNNNNGGLLGPSMSNLYPRSNSEGGSGSSGGGGSMGRLSPP